MLLPHFFFFPLKSSSLEVTAHTRTVTVLFSATLKSKAWSSLNGTGLFKLVVLVNGT